MAYQPLGGQRLAPGPAWVDYSTVRTFPALEQKSSWFEQNILDPMRSFGSGSNSLLSGAGWLAEQMGAEDFGGAIQEFAQHGVDYWQSSLTPETQDALKKDLFDVTDQGVDFNFTKLVNGVAGSAPSFVVGLGAGGVLAKGLQLFANPLGRTALVEAINAGKVAGPGTTAWATAESAAKSLQFVDNLIGIGGYGASEGAMAGAAVGAEVSNTIKAMDHATLSEKSERYRALYDSYDGEPEERRQQLAKGALADEASTDAGWKSGLATAVLGAPAGAFFGRVLGPSSTRLWAEAEKFAVLRGSRLGAAVEGFATEGISEAAQSGSEQLFTNLGIQQADETKDTWEGVGAAAIEGGIIGGVLGGGVGAVAGNEHTQQAQIDSEKETDQRNTDRLIATSLEAIKGHGLDDYAARILEAQPERGRLQTLSDLAYMAENGAVRDDTLEELFPDLGADADPRDTFDQQGFGRTVRAEDAGPFTGKRTAYSEALPAKGDDEGDKEYAYRMIDMVGQPTELPEDYGRYFEMKKADFIVPIEKIKPAKKDRSSNNSTRLMALAGEGVLPRRAPIDVRLESDGSYTILDGNGTHAAAKTFGWKEMPVRVKEVAPDLKESGFRTYENPRGFLKDEATNRKLTEIYRKAEADMPAAQELFEGVAGSVGGELEMGDLKGRFRAEEKTAADYGGDPTRLKDLVRGTIVVDTVSQARDVARRLGAKVVEQKDSLSPDAPAYPGGYRDMKLIVDVNGTRSELQINLRPMVDAKDKAHKLYDKARTLEGQAKIENRDLTPIETIKLNALIKQQEQIYLPAWESILSQESAGSGYNADGLSRSDASSRRPGAPGASNATSAEPVESDIQATGMPSYQNSSLPAGKSAADLTPPAITSERDFTPNSPSSTSGSIVPRQQTGEGLRFSLRESANEAATSDLNDRAQPTAAQTSAGNYAHGHPRVKGLDISIENPSGSTRTLSKREGKIQLKDHYGYIRGFTGADNEKLDVYVKDTDDDSIEAAPIFAVEQLTPDGKFDEHKVYMGYGSDKEVRASFLAHQQLKPAMRMGPKIRKFDNVAEFKQWAREQEQTHQAKKAGFETMMVDKRLQVRGDLVKARQLMKDVGIPTKGTIKRDERGEYLDVTPAAANAVKAAITGRESKGSRAGMVVAHSKKADGTLLGAPPKYNTDAKMAPLRALLKKLSLEGEPGRFWYEQSSQDIMDFVGGDKEEADLFAKLLAIYSPQMKVDANTSVAIKVYYQLKAGLPVQGKTGPQDRKAQAAFDGAPLREWMGEKTNNFYVNLMLRIDPAKVANLQGATIDMWMMRAFEYESDAPTATQYHFAEIETNRIARELGWEPQQVQAAIWVAMKARTENKGVKDATEAQSEKAGDMTWVQKVDEETGATKSVRDFPDDAAAARHRRRWLDNALAHDPTKDDTSAAGFHFGNGLRAHLSQMSWEAVPSTDMTKWSWIHGNMAAKMELQARMADAIGSRILRIMGLMNSDPVVGMGGWKGAVSPSAQETVVAGSVTYKDSDGKPGPRDVSPQIAERMNAACAIYAYLLKQDGVAWHRPMYDESGLVSNGVHFEFGRSLTAEETLIAYDAVTAELMNTFGVSKDTAQMIAPIPHESGIRFVNFPDGDGGFSIDIAAQQTKIAKDNAAEAAALAERWRARSDKMQANDSATAEQKAKSERLAKQSAEKAKIAEAAVKTAGDKLDHKLFVAAVERAIESTSLPDPHSRSFRSVGDFVGNNWKEDPSGENLVKRATDAGFGDQFRRAVGELQSKVTEVYEGIANKYGPARGKGELLFRLREEGSAGSAPDARGTEARQDGQVAPPKFTSQKIQRDAVSAVGIHYGKAGLKALDPTMAGTGAAGGERRRLGMGRFGLTNPRVNFYIREPGQAVPPSEAVVGGAESYQVELMNLYDYDADPRGFFAKYPNNVDMVEEEVADAGFDGILFPKHPQIPVRTAIVFGFKRKIPVVPVPAGEPVMDLRYSLKDAVPRADKMLDIPSVEIGRGGRAPAGGIYVSGRFYDGGEFLPEEYPGGKSAARKLAAKVDGNIAELRVRPSSASTGAGKAWIEVKMAGQDRFRIMGSSPFDSLEKAIFVASEIVSERDNYYRSRGVMPHPTEVTVVGDDAKYSLGEPKQSGLTAKAVQGLVNTLNWAGKDKIRVFDTVADLPLYLQQSVESGAIMAQLRDAGLKTVEEAAAKGVKLDPHAYDKRAQGFYDPASKSAVVIAGNIDSPEQAYRTIVEEHLRHEGMRRFFTPAKLDQFLDGIYSALPQEGLRAVAKTYSANLDKPEGRRLAAEEYIAKMRLDQERSPLMARVGDWVRGQLRSMGFKMTYSNRDVIHILQQIEDGVRSGRIASPAWNGQGDDPVAPMYSLSGETDRWYYSAMLRSVETGTGAPKKAGATQWKQWLDGAQRRGEFKQAEREWIGVDEWLDGRGDTTRAELVEFVNSSQVMVDETVLGDMPSIPWQPAREDDLPDGVSSGSKYTTRNGETFTKFQFAGGWYAEVSSRGGRSRKVVDNAGSEEALDAELMTYVAGELETPSSVKFDSYQIPGGENYRELLLTMPQKKMPGADELAALRARSLEIQDADSATKQELDELQAAQRRIAEIKQHAPPQYQSSHFDQPNILAHVRFNERTDADGKRVLFVEEVQSDWNQDGRERGYRPTAAESALAKKNRQKRYQELGDKFDAGTITDAETSELNALAKHDVGGAGLDAVPPAPIGSKTVFDVMVDGEKAMLPNGKPARYGSEAEAAAYADKVGGKVSSARVSDTEGWAMLAMKRVIRWAAENGFDRVAWTTGDQQNKRYPAGGAKGEKIAHGMESFYDKMLPTEIGKYVKKFGGQVSQTGLRNGGGVSGVEVMSSLGIPMNRQAEFWANADRDELIEQYRNNGQRQPSIDITPAMRQAAISGQPLFRLRDVTSTPEIEGARRFISGPRPAAMSLGDRVRVLMRDIYRTWTKQNALEIEQGLFDSGASIKDWEKRLTGALQDASESAGKMYDLARNPAAVLASVMRTGVPKLIDGAFQPVAGRKGLIDVFRPLYEQAPSGTTLVHLWEDYAAARRSSRLITEQNRDGSSREKQLSEEQIKELLKLGGQYLDENGNSIFEQVFDDWQAFNSQMLDFAVENGVLSAQMRKMWAANDYVPFYRVIEELTDQAAGNSSSSRLTGRQVRSKRLTGGVGVIEPIFESIVKNSAYVLDSVYKNETMKRTVKMLAGHALTRAPMSFQPVRFNAGQIERALQNAGIVMMSERDLAAAKPAGQMALAPTTYRGQLKQLNQQELDNWNTMFTMVAPAGSNVVSVMIDGKAQYYFVDDPLLLRSIQAIGPQSMSHLMKFMSGGKELLTNLVTTDPGFMAVNFLRDTISAWVTSSAPFKPVLDGFKGALDSFKDDPLRWKLQTAGASLGGYYDTRGADAYAAMELDTGSAPKLGVRANWRRWQRFGAHFENANRMAIARSIIDSGGTVAEAAYQALDIMNFSMHGDSKSIRALTMTVPFMNARLQGLYRLWRGRNAASFWQRGAIVAGATLALMFKNWDDDRYWELEEFERDAYWHFWLGDEHIKIAKPFEVGQLFGTIWERTAATAFGPDTARLLIQRMGSMAFDTFAMNPVPQIVKPIIEQYANKNSFTGRPIENQSLQGLLPEQRYMPWTSESARVFAAALPDWAPAWLRSPVRVEALVRGYMGTLGLYALQASDQIARPLGGFGEPPAMALKDMPVVRRFYGGDTATRTKYEEPIYKLLDIANETRKSVMELRRRGDAEGANEIAQSNADILAARGRLNAFSTQMRALNMQERAVWNSSFTAGEKKVKIDALRARRNDMLRNSSELLEKLDPYLPYL